MTNNMAVSKKDVEHIAKLAKLKFTEEEKKKLQGELNSILDYMDKLNELDLENVKPLENINETIENVLREDEVIKGVTKEEALKNAPAKTENFFKVPKVLDK
jgi:aspartyl-tRNA(Asn)/glutamyl-tRNA(Gln) amidotransferase subunit C